MAKLVCAAPPQGLANTLTGLAALRVQLPGRVVELLLRGALGPRTLAEAAPPPALGPGAGPVELEAAGPVVAVPNARGMGTQSPPGDKERQLQQRPVPGVTPGELASVALALSRCGHVPSGRWAGRFLAAAARQMGSFGARWVGARETPSSAPVAGPLSGLEACRLCMASGECFWHWFPA